jgi:antiviral helicase SKI2
MVFICKYKYTNEDLKNYFEKYSFELSDFQKYAIESIVGGNHILITAHTGSGKTLPAEFAIEYFTNKLKKVIYTSPIKALSNQKFYEFSKKFPNINFGILTGDIKYNPDADVLIMTTEILQNNLYKKLQQDINSSSVLDFDLDINNDLSCVIFDEIHYINDKDRGKVWEETLMMLPRHVQMVMLSATIDNPEGFAKWCEDRHEDDNKKVWLASSEHRVVPLKHYVYVNSVSGLYKKIKDETLEKEIKSITGKPLILKDDSGYKEDNLVKVNKVLKLLNKNEIIVKPQYVLNELIKYLYDNDMLPCLCFVFSRKNVEKYASQITVNLFDYDSAHVPSIIKDECFKIVKKLPNYKDIIELPEYLDIIKLLEKGVAIHHSGVMPIMREIVEILYGKGYIKVLFATETFAVGINMPTKSVIFTALSKYSDDGVRNLFSHEYTQMAGRAGRRGLDTVGHVIHCNNLFRQLSYNDYSTILSGKPQKLESKFQISYNLLLNLIETKKIGICDFINNSMMGSNIDKLIKETNIQIENIKLELKKKETTIRELLVDDGLINKYINLSEMEYLSNKKKKEVTKQMEVIKNGYPKNFEMHLNMMYDIRRKRDELLDNKSYIENLNNHVESIIMDVTNILLDNDYLVKEDNKYSLTSMGVVASKINETNSLVLSKLICDNDLNNLNSIELVCLFGCFTNINVRDEIKMNYPSEKKYLSKVGDVLKKYLELLNKYEDLENNYRLNCSKETNLQYDIMEELYEWCESEDEYNCKIILEMLKNKEIFLGEFVKSILSIINISNECIFAAEYLNNVPLLVKLSEIPEKIMKFVVNNQSLYIKLV